MKTSQPPKQIQDAFHSALAQELFAPLKEEYLSDTEQERRLQATKKRLKPFLNNEPNWVAWLTTIEYQHPDEFNYYFQLRGMMINLISEMEGGNESLYQLAVNKDNEWYVRRGAIQALSKNQAKEQLTKLLETLLDYHVTPPDLHEVHEGYLSALAANQVQEAMPYLRRIQTDLTKLSEANMTKYGFDDDFSSSIKLVTTSRAALGDSEVLIPIIKLSYDAWYSTRKPAEAALKDLIKQRGEDKILQQLSGDDFKESPLAQYRELSLNHKEGLVRTWALDRLITSIKSDKNEIIEHLIKMLGDEQPQAKMTAVKQLIQTGKNAIPALTRAVTADSTPITVKYALLNVLTNLDVDILPWQSQLESAYVPLPEFITPLMRRTIVEEWANRAETGTDIRWLTEYRLTASNKNRQAKSKSIEMVVKRRISISGVTTVSSETQTADKQESNNSTDLYQAEKQIALLVADLTSKGHAIDKVIDYAAEMQQGGSSFYLVKMVVDNTETETTEEGDGIETAVSSYRDRLNISKLAPFVFYERHESTEFSRVTTSENDEGYVSGMSGTVEDDANNGEKYKEVVEANGFIWLSDKQLSFTIPGLNIYFFGDRKPLSVRDLLFYWQD